MSEQQPPQDKYTAAQVADALRKARGIYAVAARALECDRRTIVNYVNRYATVKAAAEEATATVIDVAESFLIRDVYEGKFDQIKYYLNAKGKERGYGIERQDTNVTGDVTFRGARFRTIDVELPDDRTSTSDTPATPVAPEE